MFSLEKSVTYVNVRTDRQTDRSEPNDLSDALTGAEVLTNIIYSYTPRSSDAQWAHICPMPMSWQIWGVVSADIFVCLAVNPRQLSEGLKYKGFVLKIILSRLLLTSEQSGALQFVCSSFSSNRSRLSIIPQKGLKRNNWKVKQDTFSICHLSTNIYFRLHNIFPNILTTAITLGWESTICIYSHSWDRN